MCWCKLFIVIVFVVVDECQGAGCMDGFIGMGSCIAKVVVFDRTTNGMKR